MPELEPADRTACQCDRPRGGAFKFGDPPRVERCGDKPCVIVHEKNAGPEGKCGSMSLCAHCFGIFQERFDVNNYRIEPINLA